MRSLANLPLALVLLQLILLVDAAPYTKLAALCAGGENVELKTVVDVEALLSELDQSEVSCPPRVVDAIRDMAAIARDKQACRMDKAEAILEFVDKYLRQSPAEIPRPLADFAVAYGMQVSRLCSQEMVETFSESADARLYDKLGAKNYEQFKTLKRYLIEESSVGAILLPILKTGELVLPVDLMQIVPELGGNKLEISIPLNERIANIKSTCENLLQPLYESTLLPLARLNRAGFNDVAFYWRKVHKDNGRFWSIAVYLCESLKMIKLKEDQVGEASGNKLDKQKDAAATCELPGTVESLGDQAGESESGACTQLVEERPVEEYKSELQVGDEIVSNSVRALLRNYNANKNEVERLRERIQNRSFNLLVAMVRRGKFKEMAVEMLRQIEVRTGAEEEDFEKTRAMMLELMESAAGSDSCPSEALQRVEDKEALGSHERKGMGFWGKFFTMLGMAILFGILDGLCGTRTIIIFPWWI